MLRIQALITHAHSTCTHTTTLISYVLSPPIAFNCTALCFLVSQAIDDFTRAEQRNYTDRYTLITNRGIVYRLLKMPAEALIDFITASKLLNDTHTVIQ